MSKLIEQIELKDIQKSILKDIAGFCSENNIKYFVSYGSLIGVIRHKGYIPWDDDIDISMYRPDYDRFFKLYNERESPYRAISHEIDSDYSLPFGKVHDSRTEMHETMYKRDIFGVYVDIFPIDGCDEKGKIMERNLLWSRFLNTKKAVYDKKRTFSKNLIIALGKLVLFPISINRILQEISNNARKYPYETAQFVGNVVAPYGTMEVFSKSDIEELTSDVFEGLEISIPHNYDLYLKKIYGNYMKLPPIEEQVSHHTFKAWWK